MNTKLLLPLAITVALSGCLLESEDDTTAAVAEEVVEEVVEEVTPEPVTNKVAAITDLDTGDTGELRYAFDSGLTQGSASFTVLHAEGESEPVNIALYDSATSTSSLIADLRMDDDGEFSLRGNDFEFPVESNYTPGEFVNIQLTWDTSDLSQAGNYTVIVNDAILGTFTSENVTPGVEVTALAIRLSSNGNTATTAVLVDDIAIHSDEAATTEIFSEDFESFEAGHDLNADPFHNRTFSATVIEEVSDE